MSNGTVSPPFYRCPICSIFPIFIVSHLSHINPQSTVQFCPIHIPSYHFAFDPISKYSHEICRYVPSHVRTLRGTRRVGDPHAPPVTNLMQVPKTDQAWKEVDHFQIRTEEWRFRKVQVGSMLSYFNFAKTQIMDYESEYKNLSLDFKPTKCVSCGIAAYGHMRSCLHFAEKIAHSIKKDIAIYKPWMKDLIDKRDRIQAHPNVYRKPGTKKDISTINVHECVLISPDKLQFPLWDQNLTKAEDRIEIILAPREDLSKLSELLEFISQELLEIYHNELKS